MELSYSIAFLLGLFSSVHCLGMCGGIIGALSMGLPQQIRSNGLSGFILVSGFNIGRISSYACAGFLAASIGTLFLEVPGGHHVLQIFAAVILIFLGLHIGGWLPRLSVLENIGMKAWRYISPLGKRFLPVDSIARSLMMGMVWGWLPCGLVYSVLLWTSASGNPVTGALIMLSFGLGTLPAMITTGMAAGMLRGGLHRKEVRRIFAVVIILIGLAFPWMHQNKPMAGDPASPIQQHH